MSPLSSALCTSVSGTSLPRFTRISNGLLASSESGSDGGVGFRSGIARWADGAFADFADFADFAALRDLRDLRDFARASAMTAVAVERAVDHVHLLLAREA